MNVARSALATALSCTFAAIVAFGGGCSSSSSQGKGDCRDSNGEYVSEFLGCRGNKKAACHVEYLSCDRERCRGEAISIQLAECPPDRPICQDQRDVNGPVSVCHAQALDKSCRAELVVDGAPFAPDLIADLDHDGRSDLLRWGGSMEDGVMVALANVDGSFRRAPSVPGDFGLNKWLADVDGDGNLDLVIDSYASNPVGPNVIVTLLIAGGRGDGTFRPTAPAPSLGDKATVVAILDVNGDKRADIVSWDEATQQLMVLLGGQGPFVRSAPFVVECELHDCPGSLLVVEGGDLNGDGFGDFVHVDNDGRLIPVLGSASGVLTRGPVQTTFVSNTSSSRSSVLADVDGDGHLDLVERNGQRLWIRPGNGDATFRDVIEVDAAPYRVDQFRIRDLDNDGLPELLLADRDEVVIVRKNTGSFTFAPPKVYQPGPSIFGFLGALTPAPGAAPSIVAGSFLVPASCR